MKAGKRTIFFLIWAVLAVTGCILLWRFGARYTYQHPILIAENSAYTVVVDDNERQTNLIQLDRNNRVVSRISYDRLDEDVYHMAWELFYAEDAWYLVDFYNNVGQAGNYYGLYRLDFESREMVPLYEDLEAVLNQAAGEAGYEAYLIDGQQFSVRDGVISIQAGGVSFDRESYYILLFRLENGACSLEEAVAAPRFVRDAASLGSGWVTLPENNWGLYNGEQCLSQSDYSMLVTSGEGHVYGINQSSGVIQQVMEGEDALQTNQDFLLNQLTQYGLDIRGIRSLDMADESNFAAAYFDLNTPCLLLGRDGNLVICSSSSAVSLPIFMLWCVLLILAVGLVQLGVVLAVRRIRRRGSVVVKILAALIPAMVLISVCSTMLVAWLLEQYNLRQDQATMAAIGQEVHALGIHENAALLESLYASVSQGTALDSTAYDLYLEMYYDLMQINQNLSMQPEVLDMSSGQELSNQLRCGVAFYALDQETGSYYGVGTTADLRPFDYWMAPGQAALFWEQIQQGGQALFEFYSVGDQKLSGLIYPTRQESGEINGFYLISADPIEGDNRISQVIRQFALYQLILCVLLLLLFTPIIFLSLRPLSVLRGKARQLAGGTMPVLTPPEGRLKNEITELNETFRLLTAYVRDNMARMIRLQELSRAYFSRPILQLLGKTSVSQLTFHESVTCPLYIAYLRPDIQTFSEIQALVQQCIPLLESCGGFFGSVRDDEIVMVSRQSALFYAAAAVAQERRELRVAFDYAPVTVCVAGTEAEYRFLVAPENENRKNTLCTYRDAFQCRLLAFAGAVPQGQKELNSRLVAQMDSQMLVEFFLDAFSNPYRLGQRDLEQGVHLFFSGELDRARSSLIQALRCIPQDPVALYYIALIDAQRNQAQRGEYV